MRTPPSALPGPDSARYSGDKNINLRIRVKSRIFLLLFRCESPRERHAQYDTGINDKDRPANRLVQDECRKQQAEERLKELQLPDRCDTSQTAVASDI